MPRKFFRRFLPDSDAVRASRHLAWCSGWLQHPNLWCLNRGSVAGGFAIGLFAGLVPGPLQMLTAALIAIPLKKNLPVALATTLYTNPFTIAPLYLVAYGYGRLLLGSGNLPLEVRPYHWDWAHWLDSLLALAHWALGLGPPLAVGLIALALTLAAAGYCAVQIFWRAYVIHAWRSRGKRRAQSR